MRGEGVQMCGRSERDCEGWMGCGRVEKRERERQWYATGRGVNDVRSWFVVLNLLNKDQTRRRILIPLDMRR